MVSGIGEIMPAGRVGFPQAETATAAAAGSPGSAGRVDRLSGGPTTGAPFVRVLQEALTEVNALQLAAEEASRRLVSGSGLELHQVVLATEKASLALQLTIQVRNKILDAFQEVMRMPV